MKLLAVLLSCVFILSGCVPNKFEIKEEYNEFRNTSSCDMIHNSVIDNTNHYLNFDISVNSSPKSSFNLLNISKISVSEYPLFKNDSHARLTFNSDNKDIMIIKAINSGYNDESYSSYSPGHLRGNTYVPGISTTVDRFPNYVNFVLTDKQMEKILNATELKLELETTDEKIQAVFTQDNFNHFEEFKQKCLKLKK